MIRVNKNLKQINRKTDSLLDWFGDWGGLYGSLSFIGQNMVSSYTLHQLQTYLAYLLVRIVPQEKSDVNSLLNKEDR